MINTIFIINTHYLMSYLDVLMQNGAPDEGENSCVFKNTMPKTM